MNRFIIPGLFLLVLGGGLAWRVQQVQLKAAENAQARAGARLRAANVTVAPVVRRDLETQVEELVTIRAPLNVNVAAKVSGRIEYLKVHEGDRVRAGELLVRLDPSELLAREQEMRAALAAAEARLSEARLGARPQMAQTQAAIVQAEAEVSAAAAALRQAEASTDSQRATARHALDEANTRLQHEQDRLRRLEVLLEKGFVPAQQVDTARAARDVAQANVDAAQERVKLVDAQVKADLDVARENLKRARARLRLAEANRAHDRMYLDHIASLKAAVAQARSALLNAVAARRQTEIHAPIDSFVSARMMDPGAMATPGQPILTLVDIRTVWAEVSLSEEYAGKVRVNDRGIVTLDAFPGRHWVGRVIQINPSANPQSRAFVIRMQLDNPTLSIKPGMFGRARFVVERRPGALVVPREALIEAPDQTAHVFVVDDGRARKLLVRVGARRGPWVEVAGVGEAPLREGQPVVTIGHQRLEDGAEVKIAPDPAVGARPETPIQQNQASSTGAKRP